MEPSSPRRGKWLNYCYSLKQVVNNCTEYFLWLVLTIICSHVLFKFEFLLPYAKHAGLNRIFTNQFYNLHSPENRQHCSINTKWSKHFWYVCAAAWAKSSCGQILKYIYVLFFTFLNSFPKLPVHFSFTFVSIMISYSIQQGHNEPEKKSETTSTTCNLALIHVYTLLTCAAPFDDSGPLLVCRWKDCSQYHEESPH